MKKTHFVTLIAIIVSPFILSAQNVVTEQSVVSFEISNFGVKTVKGTFTGMTGTVVFNTNEPESASINVCIDPATVNTDNAKRDAHLKNEDFFEVETYPTICYKSSSIAKTKTGYLAKGRFTMHGVTKEVEIPLTYANNTLTGEIEVDRLDFGVGPKNTATVGNSVTLTIVCVLE